MPIDASIYQGIKQYQQPDTLNQLAGVLGIQQAQTANALNQYKIGQAQRADERANALLGLAKGWNQGTTDQDRINSLKNAGYFDEADKLEKGVIERGKAESESRAKDIETAKKKIDILGNTMGFVMKNPSIENANSALDFLGTQGVLTPEQVAQHKATAMQDPSKIANLAQMAFRSALDAKSQLETLSNVNLGGTEITQGVDPVTGQVRQIASYKKTATPGELLTDARERQKMERDKFQYDAERGGLVNMQTGEFKPATQGGVPIGAKDKPLNDSQAKSLGFGTRMQEADKTLDELSELGTATSIPGSMGVAGGVINALSSENQQRLDQAKRDFMTAILRRESGAAISTGEFDTANKQYFPQIGDTKGVIEQKARNRKLAIQGVLSEVPEKQRGSITPKVSSGFTYIGKEQLWHDTK